MVRTSNLSMMLAQCASTVLMLMFRSPAISREAVVQRIFTAAADGKVQVVAPGR